MEEESIRFSLFRGRNDSVLTKQYRLNDSGDICKESAPYFSNGTAETVCIEKLLDIESEIENLGSNECISTGVFDSPSCEIVTSDTLDEERLAAGARSRTRSIWFSHLPGLSCWIMTSVPICRIACDVIRHMH